MKSSIFLNDMLTKGAILGGVMLVSNIAETAIVSYGSNPSLIYAMAVEVIAVIALYIWLLVRFTSNYANLVIAERKEMAYFTYGNGLSYVVSVSMLASVIVAVGGYMFRHYVVGFENYIANSVKLVEASLSQSEVPAASIGSYEQMFKAIQSQDEPSFISSIISNLWNYLLGGTFVGLFIAAKTRRAPKIFDNKDEQ